MEETDFSFYVPSSMNSWYQKKKKKKGSFRCNVKVKTPQIDLLHTTEAGMMCTIDVEMFFSFGKNAWIQDLGTLCHLSNNDSGLYNITNINKS